MAAKQKVTDLVMEMVAPVLREAGLELVEVEYKKEGANWILRVFLDRPGGAVDLDDCAHVSEALSTALDETDPIPSAYFLEVSSAGAERTLKTARDFELAIGKRIFVSFYEPFEGNKNVEGTLMESDEEVLRVWQDPAMVVIPKDKIASVRLALVW
ncbi:ribosome maturation factor RimP [Sulfoacidibacillus ferrooxidans]|uniref:Ribosome maturation factor RimP n=1 Tax=Sulfoacidibacillus ferrooxidans TaxID=2005001 RepID=A0A9X2ABY9_9BACL|nr:ribosome maturation factor RimP [Sulfoacidibacillus ferrooxidans]MCI0183623.1 Ribosome maturation factor RimP [Sulfoacidibacillus ferrooxidans]